MIRRPPRSTRTDTRFPSTTLFRSGADHDARRRLQGRAAGVFEGFARLQHGLLADDARTADLLHPSEGIGDLPIAVSQLHGLPADVFDPHLIRSEERRVGKEGGSTGRSRWWP